MLVGRNENTTIIKHMTYNYSHIKNEFHCRISKMNKGQSDEILNLLIGRIYSYDEVFV